jgi:hypothetical protein
MTKELMVPYDSVERRGNALTKFYNSVLAVIIFRNQADAKNHLLLGFGHHLTLQVHLSFLLLGTESSAVDTLGNIVLTESLDFRLSNF